ncbi:MAG: hypothetical protein KAU14_04460 [Thermoplasmata archaeon]|nr:hypothetical protein [Thermoplasmata archaeon]
MTNINRTLALILTLTLALSILPMNWAGAEESNHVHTRVDPNETIKPFDPEDSVDFEVTFYSETGNHEIHANYSAVDIGGEFNLTNWEITFDKTDFTVYYNEPIKVTITVKTNLTVADKGRYLDLTVWGDVADPNSDDIDTNASSFRAIIAKRDDVKLSVDAEHSMKLVYPRKEVQFNFYVQNIGWASNTITLSARILGPTGPNWTKTVKVIYASLDRVQPLETRVGMVNVSTPESVSPGDYTLQVTARVGSAGRDTLDLIARVAKPDLSVKEIVPLYNPVLDGVQVRIKAVIENEGGYVTNVNVRGDLMGHEGKWIRIPDVTIPCITNYNDSVAILTWTAEKTDKGNFSELWTIRITVDDWGSIDETDEGNNQGTTGIVVRGIEKSSVSFDPTPALMILGIMLVFTAAVVLDVGRKID